MHAEAQIVGFTEENIASYVVKFLGQKHRLLKSELLEAARRKGLYAIMRIPIILQMVCILYVDDKTLPSTKTGVVQDIINKYVPFHLGFRTESLESHSDVRTFYHECDGKGAHFTPCTRCCAACTLQKINENFSEKSRCWNLATAEFLSVSQVKHDSFEPDSKHLCL